MHENITWRLYGKVIKNTGNLDTINSSATNESKESAEQSNHPARRQKMEWLVLGVRRRSSQWKGESKGVVVWLTRERA